MITKYKCENWWLTLLWPLQNYSQPNNFVVDLGYKMCKFVIDIIMTIAKCFWTESFCRQSWKWNNEGFCWWWFVFLEYLSLCDGLEYANSKQLWVKSILFLPTNRMLNFPEPKVLIPSRKICFFYATYDACIANKSKNYKKNYQMNCPWNDMWHHCTSLIWILEENNCVKVN